MALFVVAKGKRWHVAFRGLDEMNGVSPSPSSVSFACHFIVFSGFYGSFLLSPFELLFFPLWTNGYLTLDSLLIHCVSLSAFSPVASHMVTAVTLSTLYLRSDKIASR